MMDDQTTLNFALIYATEFKSIGDVEDLLKQGAFVDAVEGQGWTPLMLATSGDKLEVLELLLMEGASTEIKDKEHQKTALMSAARLNHLEAIDLLLSYGAQIDQGDKDGWTALTYAVKFKKREAVELLLSRGANPDAMELAYQEPAVEEPPEERIRREKRTYNADDPRPKMEVLSPHKYKGATLLLSIPLRNMKFSSTPAYWVEIYRLNNTTRQLTVIRSWSFVKKKKGNEFVQKDFRESSGINSPKRVVHLVVDFVRGKAQSDWVICDDPRHVLVHRNPDDLAPLEEALVSFDVDEYVDSALSANHEDLPQDFDFSEERERIRHKVEAILWTLTSFL